MKRIAIIGLTLALAACKVEKTGKDTYKVVTPTPEAKEAGQKLKQDAAKLGEKVKEEAKEINNSQAVKDAKEGVGKAAESAGKKLQEKGKEAQDNAKKP